MRILMLTDGLGIGGAETHVLELIRGLQEKGHAVTLLSSGGVYTDEVTASGALHICFPFDSGNPFLWISAYRRLSKLLKSRRYDIMHAHTRKTAFLASLFSIRESLPLVTTAHWTFDTRFPKGRLTKWGARTLAVSSDIRDYLLQSYSLYPDNIRVTVNGISERHFYPAPSPDSAMPRRVVTVSRLDTGRSLTAHLLLDAAARLILRYPDFRLTICGDGNEYETLRKKAAEIEKKVNRAFISFTGSVTDVGGLLRKHDIFVGVSRSALEALFCGLPTVLSGDEGYLSVFSEETADRAAMSNLCLRGSAPAFADKLYRDLSRLMEEDREQRIQRRSFALEYVRRHYSVSRMTEDVLSVYAAICPTQYNENSYFKEFFPHSSQTAVLLGYYGRKNLGDEATLRAAIRFLRKCGYQKITVISKNPREIMGRETVKSVHFLNFPRILWEFTKNSTLFLGGGTLLQDKTSHRSLLYYTTVCRIALLFKRQVTVLAGGIGALSKRGKKNVKSLLSRADVTLRTPSDIESALSLGVPNSRLSLLPDLVFSLYREYGKTEDPDTLLCGTAEKILFFDRILETQATPALTGEKITGILEKKPCLLFAIRGSVMDLRLLSAIQEETEKRGLFPLFAVLSPEDAESASRYACLTKGAYTRVLTPKELSQLLPLCRYAAGNRLHFLLFSLMAGVPFLPLSYDEKNKNFCHFVNYILQKICFSSTPSARKDMRQLSLVSLDSKDFKGAFHDGFANLLTKEECRLTAESLRAFYE